MASALCLRCNAEFHWVARRGMRLAHVVSPCCGTAGQGYRYDKRRSLVVRVERLGSLAPPEGWTWTPGRLVVYLLADGNIQLDNRAIYAPVYRSGGAVVFRYAGRDSYCADYRLRMREQDYRELAEGSAREEWSRALPNLLMEGWGE